MDHLSTCSGRISAATMDHEQSKLRLETRDHNEIILMRLRRLSRTVMCKSERHRFEARTLQRSNIIKYLEDNLLHPSEQIRFVALELLCCTIPRLANKTDCLLKPLLPKVFQCLKKNESKELKTRALHFLRGYFQHTRRLSGFIDNFVKIGIQSSDPEIQISCCLGLNIIFDQDLGNGLYSQLVMPVANILMQKSNFELARSAYRALKCIHKTVSDARFFDLINMAQPVAAELYRNIYNFDETDSFLTMEDNDCSTVILEYQVKRYYLNLSKDFGILDPDLLYQIQKTRSCERARATSSFFLALKQTPWTADDLDPHILDFVKFINSLVSDSNRLVQMYGFDILKEVINRMGFTLAPHIYWVVNILRQGLVSENSKIKLKVYRVLYKLMRCIHPMTVVWNLLKTDETSIKEAVIMLIQNMLSHFSYHEIDMIALCNYLGQNLEDTNSKLASCSRDCIILLLDIIRDCPAYGIKTEAVKTLLKNHSLSTQTLKDIGIIGNITEDVCREGFESYSDEEITDRDSSSLPDSGTVITTALSHRTLSTAGESDAKYGPANSGIVNLVKSFRTLCKNASCSHFQTGCKLVSVQPSDISVSMSYRSISTAGESHAKCDDAYSNLDLIKSSKTFYDHLMGTNMYEEHKSINNESPKRKNAAENLDLDSSRNEETTVTWDENYIDSLKKIEENASAESSVSSSIKEQLLSLDSTPSRSAHKVSCEKHKSNASTQPWADFINIDDNLECCHKYEAEECNLHQILAPEKLNTGCRKRRYFTRFFMKSAVDDFASNSEKKAEGDVYIILENNSTATQKFDKEMNTAELTSDAQNCIQVDVMNNNDYNFNIMTIDHPETDKDSNYTDDFDSIDDTDGTGDNNKLKKIQTDTDEECPRHKPKNVQKSFIPRLDPNTKDCELLENISQAQSKYPATLSQKLGESNICKEKGNDVEVMNDAEIDKQLFQETLLTENSFLSKETHDELTNPVDEEAASMQMSHLIAERNDVCVGSTDKNEFLCEVSFQKEEGIPTEASPFNSKDLDETPFMPKNRQLPRTPVQTKAETSIDAQPKLPKFSRKKPTSIKRKGTIKKNRGAKEVEINKSYNQCEESSKELTDETSASNSTFVKSCVIGKYNSPRNWGGCQWRRDLEYASKALPCPWVDKFEKTIEAMKPFSSLDVAENEMKKAIEDLNGNSWKKKEDAMLSVIQLAKYHPEVVQENTSKVAFALCNEVRNFRQSVAGKAILTIGHLYEIRGKQFENRLRLVISALLAKSSNRTLAAYFRLVIKTLFKVINSSPQKAALAFFYEGYQHINKAARDIAAQFLTILTEYLGPENTLAQPLSSHMLKCAAAFAFDSSALTRYCGKRMLKVFMAHPDFEKIKDHLLDIDTAHKLSKVLEQITSKGVGEDVLPISLID